MFKKILRKIHLGYCTVFTERNSRVGGLRQLKRVNCQGSIVQTVSQRLEKRVRAIST